jgi:hypothetical protein
MRRPVTLHARQALLRETLRVSASEQAGEAFHQAQPAMLDEHLAVFPAVAPLGARQVGKTTLARQLRGGGALYLDLEAVILSSSFPFTDDNTADANRKMCRASASDAVSGLRGSRWVSSSGWSRRRCSARVTSSS